MPSSAPTVSWLVHFALLLVFRPYDFLGPVPRNSFGYSYLPRYLIFPCLEKEDLGNGRAGTC